MNQREKVIYIKEMIQKKENRESNSENKMYEDYYGLMFDFNKHFSKIEEKIKEMEKISDKNVGKKRLKDILSSNRRTLLGEIKTAEKNIKSIRKYL